MFGQGVGNTMLANVIANLIGRGNTAIITSESFCGKFTDYVRMKFAVVHELSKLARVQIKIRELVGNSLVHLRGRRVSKTSLSVTNYFLTTNDVDAIKMYESDRRFFVLSHNAPALDDDFYREIADKAENPYYLQQLVDWFYCWLQEHPFRSKSRPPKTKAMAMVIEESRSVVEQKIYSAIENGQPPFATDLIAPARVLEYYQDIASDMTNKEFRGLDFDKWTAQTMAKMIRRVWPSSVSLGRNKRLRDSGGNFSLVSLSGESYDKLLRSTSITDEYTRQQDEAAKKVGGGSDDSLEF